MVGWPESEQVFNRSYKSCRSYRTSIFSQRLRTQSLDLRATGFFFQSSVLNTARNARGHARGSSIIQPLDPIAELLQTEGFVSVLAAFLLRGYNYARRQMSETDGAFRFVDVLASRAARPKRLDLTLTE